MKGKEIEMFQVYAHGTAKVENDGRVEYESVTDAYKWEEFETEEEAREYFIEVKSFETMAMVFLCSDDEVIEIATIDENGKEV